MKRLTIALIGLAILPRQARADGGGVELQMHGGSLLLRGASAHNNDRPSMVQAPTIKAQGAFQSIGLRALGWGRRVRGGLQVHILWSDAPTFSSSPLPAGYSTNLRGFWGEEVEGFVGAQGRLLNNVTVYGELRFAFYLLVSRVALQHETRGFLGDTSYTSYRGDVSPRLGMTFALSRSTYLDTSVQTSPLGPILFAGGVGLGLRLD